jgi:hypothetical protein
MRKRGLTRGASDNASTELDSPTVLTASTDASLQSIESVPWEETEPYDNLMLYKAQDWCWMSAPTHYGNMEDFRDVGLPHNPFSTILAHKADFK